ncbi:hypothetical protein ATCC90586_001716 [Pythium insidiosum]|nr:hypothetical protein ATCC90586_001716 [Pythium insidiosum]
MFSVGSSVEDAKSTTITNTNPAIETPRKFERAIRNLSKAWNLLMLFVTTYFAITVPLKAAFSNELENVPSLVTWSAIEYLMDVICILDVSLRIRRAVHHEKFMNAKTKTQRLSALMYDGFLLDIVASLPLELCIFFNRTQFVDLSFKERWPTLYAVYDLKVPLPAAYVGFAQSLITHTSGYQLTSAEVDHVSLARKYMRSMHFSVGSITTTFYGDVVSFNVPEMMIEMLVNLMSIYIFGSLIAAHGEIHEVYSRKKALFEQNLLELQHFLQQNTVPKGLKRQVKSYYASIWRRRHGDAEFAAIQGLSRSLREDVVIWRRRHGDAEFAAIQGLSRSLREDVVYETMLPFVCKVSGFRHLDIRFLRGLLTRLQYIVCSENEEVVIRGDIDRSMYFIDKGRVLVKQGTAEVTKEEGEFFGEMALLYGIPREETCIALSVSELYRLDHGPYEELVQEFPEQRQKTRREWTACAPASTPAPAPLTHGPVHDDEIDEQLVQQGFVYRAGMQLLASLNHVDAFTAREIGWKIKDSARRHAQRVFAQRSHPQ